MARSNIKAVFENDVQTVWNVITDVKNYIWRTDLKETLDIYLKLVYENSCYEHDHIKKAVSWALREIGKTDFEYAEKVLLTAYDLLASGNKVQIWIAKDVIKELETVVKVKERKRLITSNSKMGRER